MQGGAAGLNNFNHIPLWAVWMALWRLRIFPNLDDANAGYWPPTKFNGSIVIPSGRDSLWARLYLQFTAAFLYMHISRQRENRNPCICELLHMIPCIYKQLSSLFLWCFFSYPLAEKTDQVYASIFVNEQAAITSSQDYRVLYDYMAQVMEVFKRSIL